MAVMTPPDPFGRAVLRTVLIPVAIGALLIPELVTQAEELAQDVPGYAQDVTEFVQDNETLNDLNEKYDFTSEIESAASELPSRIGDAAGILGDIGVGFVNSIFAAVTILILSIFMVASGGRWVDRFISMQDEQHAERLR